MDHASSYYRAEARHARELAETTWQPALEDTLRRVAREFDEAAENIESGVADASKMGSFIVHRLGERIDLNQFRTPRSPNFDTGFLDPPFRKWERS